MDPRIGLTAAEKGEMSVTDRSQNLFLTCPVCSLVAVLAELLCVPTEIEL